jgi:hypothetical protein
MSNKVFSVKVQLTAFVQSKPIKRTSDSQPIAADSLQDITIDLCNKPENLHRFIPRFILGKNRESYKVSKIVEVLGPLGNK